MQSPEISSVINKKLLENGLSENLAEISTTGILFLSYLLISILLFWFSRKIIIGFFAEISKKTKIVAVTHCSNIIGSVNNLKLISEIVHENNAILIGDGVSFAPHGFPDVKDLDVDFYTFSLYKTYGPHVALLYGKEEILKCPYQ